MIAVPPHKRVGHVVLVSGGADSATVLGLAHRQYRKEFADGYQTHLYAFHCNYGQRTEQRELKAFRDLCAHYGITEDFQYIIDINYLKQIGKSALTDSSIEVPIDGHAVVNRYVPVSYVPFRNGNLLSIASSIASANRLSDIWIGVVQEDSSGYPDCRTEFISFMNDAINAGLPDGQDVIIRAPIIGMLKRDIIKHGREINVPYELTWSCYQSEDKACGKCDSCRLRVRSFNELGLVDSIPYAIPWKEAVALSEIKK